MLLCGGHYCISLAQGGGRKPWNSINFVCAHDGFTLADLVTYNNKHNLPNGEDNNDGENHNNSWNCGQVDVKSCFRFAFGVIFSSTFLSNVVLHHEIISPL